MKSGRTLTKDLQIDSRQHELLGIDLGEGVDRRFLLLGGALAVVWIGLALLILGVPTPATFIIYFMPPVLVTVFGAQENRAQPRRRNLTQWVLKLRQITHAHRPIIRAGARRPARHEVLPLHQRISWDQVKDVLAAGSGSPKWAREDKHFDWRDRPVGAAITMHRQPVQLIGQNHADALTTKHAKKKKVA